MKKLFGALTSIAATVLVASPAPADATTSGQYEAGLYTGAQQDYSVRLGYVHNCVADRKLENKTSKSHLDGASISEDAISLTVGMFNRFDVYARLGTAKMDLLQRNQSADLAIHTADGAAWAMGARGILYTMDNTTVSVFGEYNAFRADVNGVSLGALDSGYTAAKAHVHNWALGANAAYTIQVSPDMSVVPNVGVRVSDGKVRFTNETVTSPAVTLNRYEARGNVGASLGCGFYAGKVFGLNVQANFFDESSVAVTAEVRL